MIEQPMSQERIAQIAYGIIGERVEIEHPAYQQALLEQTGLWVPVEELAYWRGPHGGSCMIALAELHGTHPWLFGGIMTLTVCSQLLWNAFWLW